MNSYALLKFAHVVFACLAVGASASYGMWFSLGRRQHAHYGLILRGVKLIDSWLATPCYTLAGLSGLLLAYLSGQAWGALWIWGSLALFGVATLLSKFIATPTLERQIALFEGKGFKDHELQKLAAKSRALGPIMGLITMTLLYLMVAKPV